MSLTQYSGMTTKIRAMTSRLFTQEGYRQLAAEPSVPAALGFLKRHPGYTELLDGADETTLHREQIEQLLTQSLFRDFTKLYRFANPAQRSFLSLYFLRFEDDLIRKSLRFFYNNEGTALPYPGALRPFFERYSHLNLDAIAGAATTAAFLEALRGSIWYPALAKVAACDTSTLFDYEMVLDLTCFSHIWKAKDRHLAKGDLETITALFGSRMDIINLEWIYRAKKFYHLSEAEIYALLIPIHRRLRDEQMIALVEAPGIPEFIRCLSATAYGDAIHTLGKQQAGSPFEAVFDQLLLKLYRDASRKQPYSAASMNYYLRQKEQEIDTLTSIIEGIRYGLDPAANLAAALPVRQNRRERFD